ncbi:hypothetical protein Gotri_019404, partial [Gossypium trilobum]|nr:hypothetical protein [Gossypium trilobum]
MERNSTWREGFQDRLEENRKKIAWALQSKRKEETVMAIGLKEEKYINEGQLYRSTGVKFENLRWVWMGDW